MRDPGRSERRPSGTVERVAGEPRGDNGGARPARGDRVDGRALPHGDPRLLAHGGDARPRRERAGHLVPRVAARGLRSAGDEEDVARRGGREARRGGRGGAPDREGARGDADEPALRERGDRRARVGRRPFADVAGGCRPHGPGTRSRDRSPPTTRRSSRSWRRASRPTIRRRSRPARRTTPPRCRRRPSTRRRSPRPARRAGGRRCRRSGGVVSAADPENISVMSAESSGRAGRRTRAPTSRRRGGRGRRRAGT